MRESETEKETLQGRIYRERDGDEIQQRQKLDQVGIRERDKANRRQGQDTDNKTRQKQ